MVKDNKYGDFYSKGYQIFPDILSLGEVGEYKTKLDSIHQKQIKQFGIDSLKLIQEVGIVRSPFLYDSTFQDIFYNRFTKSIVKDIIGDHAILSLQNAIIVEPGTKHHQSFYHRDIIYQNFVSSKPLAINLYFCLDEYNSDNGATIFRIGSHKKDYFDSEDTSEIARAPAGSVIMFDSMIYHKAGANTSRNKRYGINNMYTLPFLKQQISYPNAIKSCPADPELAQMLGFKSREFSSVDEFRQYRLDRITNE